MINVFHCIRCGHEWESAKYEFTCPECGADVEIIIELPPGFSHRMFDTIDDMEQASERKTASRVRLHVPAPEDNILFEDAGSTLSIIDRRKEIEDVYKTRDENVRNLIEESIKTVVVDSKDNSYLTARLSPAGHIEIVDESSGKEIPWHRLNDDEQWALWLCFNDLIDEIEKVTQ
jgi:hypothetical protein